MSQTFTWITNKTAKPFYARRSFDVTGRVKSALAKVCGLGQFLFYLNGKKVSDHELDPGWTDYDKWIEYVTFDVTDDLKEGTNLIEAEIGNGWFIKDDTHYTFSFPKFMPPNPNPYHAYGDALVFGMELTVTYEDGTVEIISTDDHFEVREHPTVMTNVYGSETYDARINLIREEGWEAATVLTPTKAPKGILEQQAHPPIKVIHTYEATELPSVNGRRIFDFGQNLSGMLQFDVKGTSGDIIRIYPAEKLGPDGDVDQVAKNWVTVDSCITYIIGRDDTWETYRMKFTYFAGRYIAVEAADHVALRNLKADAISSAWETDGHFQSDDKRFEQIYHLVEKAVEANMLSVHTDCPTIERFAWQEPNHLMAPAIMYMKNGRHLWEKFLKDMRYAQHTKDDFFRDFDGNPVYPGDGLMPSQCPCYIPNVLPVPGMGSFYDIIAWGSTCILGTYWHYRFYGDRSVIEDNYEAGKRYLNHLKTRLTPDGFLNHGLGDWGNPEGHFVRENIETAFLYADASVLASFAEILGNEKDADKFKVFAETVKNNYNKKLLVFDNARNLWCYRAFDHPDDIFLTQASQALPLYWGMVPEEHKSDVIEAFRQTLLEKQAFVAGEVGLPYVIQTAREYGMNDLIAQFILRKEHPSYYAFVLDGETTLGEYWETNPRSHCHDMMGHIVEWYYNGIAGIQPLKPGFAEVMIQPYLPESMTEFDVSYHSVQGTIRVAVKLTDRDLTLTVEVPKGLISKIDTKYLEADGRSIDIIQKER